MEPGPARRLALWRVASVVLGIVAIAAAILVVRGDADARDALGRLTVPVLGVILALGIGNVMSDSMRFHAVLPEDYRRRIAPGVWHWVYATGRLLNLLVPQAGGAFRAAQLRIEYGLPVATFYGAVAVTSGLAAAMSWTFAGILVLPRAPLLGGIVLGLGIAALGGFVLGVRRLRHTAPAATPGRGRRMLARFAAAFRSVSDTHRLARVLGWSILSQICGAIALIVTAAAFEVADPIVVGAALYAGTSIASVVSLTPGGLGLTELAAGLSAHLIAEDAGLGVLIALVARATGTLAVMLVAGVAAFARRSPRGVS